MATPISLLLLEDNSADAYSLIETLEESPDQPWQITHAMHLSHALEQIRHTRFDVALLDLSLPDSEGLETLSHIRAIAPHIPLIVLTGLDDQQLALQALAQGAQDYLVKGRISPEMLVRVMRYAIERGRILRQLQAEVQERQRSEQVLRSIVEGTVSVTGEDFFRSLVRAIAQALEVRYAMVSGCIDTPPTRVRTFAFWQDNDFGENIEYDLLGTPCETVFSQQGCQYYPANLQALFPLEEDLVEMQVQSYAGIALMSSDHQILGHLAVLHDHVLENEPRDTAILEIFAARAAAEIERQRSEEALRVSREKFSMAFRSSPSAITLSTLHDGQYIEVNASALKMWGYSEAEMMGSSALDLGIWVHPEQRSLLTQQMQEQGRISNLEIEFRRKSGELFLGLVSAEVIELQHQPCLLAVTTDITLLKQASQALERLAEIGELASMVVHEIRNPLTTMLMGLNAFRRLDLSPQFQEYLSLSLEEGDRLQRLLNQILLYAKPQTLDLKELELTEWIAELLPTLKNMPAAKSKSLVFEPSPTQIKLLADQDKLKQVFINLITNAYEAVDANSIITLKVSTANSNQVCIQIHNGGDPIPEEVLAELTKPFVTTKPNGNGLGLAIVKKITEAHKGTLQIESLELKGTTVNILLPLSLSTGL